MPGGTMALEYFFTAAIACLRTLLLALVVTLSQLTSTLLDDFIFLFLAQTDRKLLAL